MPGQTRRSAGNTRRRKVGLGRGALEAGLAVRELATPWGSHSKRSMPRKAQGWLRHARGATPFDLRGCINALITEILQLAFLLEGGESMSDAISIPGDRIRSFI